MKRRIKSGLLLCTFISMLVFSGCHKDSTAAETVVTTPVVTVTETVTETVSETKTETETVTETEIVTDTETTTETFAETETEEITEAAVSVEKDGSYTTPEDVAEYIHTFGTLPPNFITKKEAQALGWDNGKGNLWDVAEGKSIGGDRFGNYEKLLPEKKGRKYTECDVNYDGGYRGAERIIFSNDGLIFYTGDHYKTFTQLY